jgi:hypothetical protein
VSSGVPDCMCRAENLCTRICILQASTASLCTVYRVGNLVLNTSQLGKVCIHVQCSRNKILPGIAYKPWKNLRRSMSQAYMAHMKQDLLLSCHCSAQRASHLQHRRRCSFCRPVGYVCVYIKHRSSKMAHFVFKCNKEDCLSVGVSCIHTRVIYIQILYKFTFTSLRVEPIHPTLMYCPAAHSLHAAHAVSLIPYPSHSLYIYWSNSHACEQLRQVMSAVPVPSHSDDARMRMP